jgi:hypothetical protein
MLRIRFKANPEDPRPINWPIKHPYWITGSGEGYSIVVSYADDEAYIHTNWPEAKDLEVAEVDGYVFTDRFPRPNWLPEDLEKATKLYDRIINSTKCAKKYQEMTDFELARELMKDVWAEIPLFTRLSELISECIDRLKGGEE